MVILAWPHRLAAPNVWRPCPDTAEPCLPVPAPRQTPVTLETWPCDRAGPLLELFNEHLAMLPYGGTVTESELLRFFEPPGAPFEDSRLLVALCEGEPVAFAQTADGAGRSEFGQWRGEHVGLLRCMLYRRPARRAAQQLLQAVDADMRTRGMDRVMAFDRLDYHRVPCAFLPDTWMHVVALLGEAGYAARPHSLGLDLEALPKEPPAPPVAGLRIAVEQLPSGVDLPAGWIEVFDGDERVSACKMNCFSEWVNGELAATTCYTDGFGVHDQYRGRGLARHCLLYSLWVMRQWGYTRASLSVDLDNRHALLLYDSLGYRQIFTQYVLSRRLAETPPRGGPHVPVNR